jgi:hypothetical protein
MVRNNKTNSKEVFMAIYIDEIEKFGKTTKRLMIDNSDSKHPNRVLGINQEISLIDGEFEYTFHIQGMESMPMIKISKQEFREFQGKLSELL